MWIYRHLYVWELKCNLFNANICYLFLLRQECIVETMLGHFPHGVTEAQKTFRKRGLVNALFVYNCRYVGSCMDIFCFKILFFKSHFILFKFFFCNVGVCSLFPLDLSLGKHREHLCECKCFVSLVVLGGYAVGRSDALQNNSERQSQEVRPSSTIPNILYACRQLRLTWKRLMSRGFPAFFRQFWLHFRKNLRKNLHMQRKRDRGRNKWASERTAVCHWKYSMSYFNKTQNTNKTNKTAVADKAHTLSQPHPSVLYEKSSFLCKNSSGILSKMLPCISISELLSQLAINSPGQTEAPPAAEPCDGGCAVATMHSSFRMNIYQWQGCEWTHKRSTLWSVCKSRL